MKKNCHCPDNEAPERQQVQRAKMKKESRKMGVDEGRKEGENGRDAGRSSFLSPAMFYLWPVARQRCA